MKPEELLFSNDHLWFKPLNQNIYQVGVTDYAQDLLGDIVFIETYKDKLIEKGKAFGIIESVKTASDLVSPVNLKVTQTNLDILDQLTDVNDKPYDSWICEIMLEEEFKFLSFNDYKNLIG